MAKKKYGYNWTDKLNRLEIAAAISKRDQFTRRVSAAFGRALKRLREERSISQIRLAELAQVDRTLPSLHERGLRHPTLTTIMVYADAMGIEPVKLLANAVKEM